MGRNNLSFYILIVLICISCYGNFRSVSSTKRNKTDSISSVQVNYHDPLFIYNNSQLINLSVSQGWGGNGTRDNPFVISNYEFGLSNFGIYIRNTSLFIIITNMNFNHNNIGISIARAGNITIMNNFFVEIAKYYVQINDGANITLDNNSFISYFPAAYPKQ